MSGKGNVPPGAIPVGNRFMYPDTQGGLHKGLDGAINENMRIEGDQSRGTSGGCHQDPGRIDPGQHPGW